MYYARRWIKYTNCNFLSCCFQCWKQQGTINAFEARVDVLYIFWERHAEIPQCESSEVTLIEAAKWYRQFLGKLKACASGKHEAEPFRELNSRLYCTSLLTRANLVTYLTFSPATLRIAKVGVHVTVLVLCYHMTIAGKIVLFNGRFSVPSLHC